VVPGEEGKKKKSDEKQKPVKVPVRNSIHNLDSRGAGKSKDFSLGKGEKNRGDANKGKSEQVIKKLIKKGEGEKK